MALRGSRRSGSAVFWLQLLTGIYLATLGLNGILGYDSGLARFGRDISRAFGGGSDVLSLIAAVVLMAGGALLVVALFAGVSPGVYRLLTLAALVVWLLRIILQLFADNFLAPDILSWLSVLSLNGIVAAALWLFSAARS